MRNQKALLILLVTGLHGLSADAQAPVNDRQKRALDVLRQTIDRQERSGRRDPVSTNAPALPRPTFAEIELQYLTGKITARQFQKYLQEYNLQPPSPTVSASPDAEARARELLRQHPSGASSNAPVVNPAASAAPIPAQRDLSDVEARMDELIRLKEARDKAAQVKSSGAATTNSTGAANPKNKRERLNEILRQNIEGKLSDAEYNEKRAKLIAEPD